MTDGPTRSMTDGPTGGGVIGGLFAAAPPKMEHQSPLDPAFSFLAQIYTGTFSLSPFKGFISTEALVKGELLTPETG